MEPVVIIGAGASGLMAAAHLQGLPVILLERLSRPGLKLLATGGGRCNLTHRATTAELCQRFGRKGVCARQVFDAFPPAAIERFFAERGCPTAADADGNVFPASNRSRDVLHVLLQATRHGEIRCNTCVQNIQGSAVSTNKGLIQASAILICGGGKSSPALGSDGSCLRILEQHGIPIVPLHPALCGLVLNGNFCSELSGLSLPAALLSLYRQSARPVATSHGALLLTHRGISGPAALALSREVRPGDTLAINWQGWGASEWERRLLMWRNLKGQGLVKNRLAEYLPARLVQSLLKWVNIPSDRQIARLGKDEAAALVRILSAAPFTICSTEGWANAMATAGGVSLKALNPRTLKLNQLVNCYCAGEMLDLDAPCGGYNLTWAFASGYVAAHAIRAALCDR
ncbi:MAG: NAD(P)/FAD-dependent oxidoreductase [Kiritimatiellia bacterium]